MSVVVRHPTPADTEAIRHLTDAAFAAVRAIYRPNPASMKNLSAIAPSLERLVAEESGQNIGIVRYGVFDRSLRVIGLAVLPNWQRRGVARQLIDALADIAAHRGCSTLSLFTVVQTGNVPIFERLGFRLILESPDQYSVSVTGQPLTEAYMERDVNR